MSDAELLERVNAWATGGKVCVMDECPRSDGRYCLDCHVDAYNALFETRRRIVAGMVALR